MIMSSFGADAPAAAAATAVSTAPVPVPANVRTPWQRPASANPNYVPQRLATRFPAPFRAFPGAGLPGVSVQMPGLPAMPAAMNPGVAATQIPTAGGGTAFAPATGKGRRGGGVNAYAVMRTGMFPGVSAGSPYASAAAASQIMANIQKTSPR